MPPPGSSVSGHDESSGDHTATDAANPPAAGAVTSAAAGPAPAAAGRHVAAGTHTHVSSELADVVDTLLTCYSCRPHKLNICTYN